MSNYRPQARDSSAVAERRQFAVWARLTPAEKFAALLDLQDTAIALADAGVRRRHPQADSQEVFLRRVARTLDAEMMQKVYGWDPREAT